MTWSGDPSSVAAVHIPCWIEPPFLLSSVDSRPDVTGALSRIPSSRKITRAGASGARSARISSATWPLRSGHPSSTAIISQAREGRSPRSHSSCSIFRTRKSSPWGCIPAGRIRSCSRNIANTTLTRTGPGVRFGGFAADPVDLFYLPARACQLDRQVHEEGYLVPSFQQRRLEAVEFRQGRADREEFLCGRPREVQVACVAQVQSCRSCGYGPGDG